MYFGTQRLDLRTLNIIRKTPITLNIRVSVACWRREGQCILARFYNRYLNTTPAIYFILPGHKYRAINDDVFVLALGGQGVFREFLKSEFSEENIEFWLACEDYKKTKSDHLHGKAERIYEEFVQSDAIKQVCTKLICVVLQYKDSEKSEDRSVASLRCSYIHSVT